MATFSFLNATALLLIKWCLNACSTTSSIKNHKCSPKKVMVFINRLTNLPLVRGPIFCCYIFSFLKLSENCRQSFFLLPPVFLSVFGCCSLQANHLYPHQILYICILGCRLSSQLRPFLQWNLSACYGSL